MALVRHDHSVSVVNGALSFLCPKLTDDSPFLIYCGQLVLADAWFYSVLQCHKQRCAFFPFPGLFVCATSLVLQQKLSQFLHI